MPFALVTIGLIMIVTGAKNTYAQFGTLLAGDFTGSNNFTYWLIAIGAVGALGTFQKFKTLSHAFLALIIIAMVLANGNPNASGGGLFAKVQQFLQNGPTAPASTTSTASNGASTIGPAVTSALPALPALATG